MNGNGTGGFGNATRIIGRIGPVIGAVLVLTILSVAGLSKVGCANHHTPPGFEGYIRSKPLVGAGSFVGIQKGPTSTGWVWRQGVINIDMRPRTYSEEMSIRTSKGTELKFRAHARIKLRESGVKEIVEKLGGEDWYDNNVKRTFQRAVREEVQKLDPFEVKNQSLEIAQYVLEKMQAEYAERPIEFISVDIGNIQYPQTIVESVIKKFVTVQENQRKDIELEITQREIEIEVAKADGISDAQRIIRKTLDPMFLQYEALEAIEQLAGSQNTTFTMVPFGRDAKAPFILNIDK
ncbi:MAG: hypothetical protein MJE77_30650 [Proteobacteria bacterium]|nr:hypothetical protein [Pseudomonadota bacterium]